MSSDKARLAPGAPGVPVYPFSAVVGQEPLKLALVLCAIDPRLGGVLVQGPRGMAKTTLARALSELIEGPFVELPLGATEDRVTGSLQLERALTEGRVEFAPGLLARAHGGVLYVDEVNLLPDALVDLLLDAAATGQNVVERDGVSHAHPARFVLVGSMNPDEGALRPQLVDRFGLSVTASARVVPSERARIVARRLEFEQAPERLRAEFAPEQQRLIEQCARARGLLPDIPLERRALEWVAERCYEAGVEGVRADLAMLRAARAHAAWHERRAIASSDIDAVAELALAHRRSERAPSEPSPGGSSSSSGGAPRASNSSASGGAEARPEGDYGASPPRPVRAETPSALPAALMEEPRRRMRGARRARSRGDGGSGVRTAAAAPRGAVDWARTLLSRRSGERRIHHRARLGPARQLVILVVDCSSSMLRSGGLAAAKGIAGALAHAARRARSELALISFRGSVVDTRLGAQHGQLGLERAIADLGGGGGTPLRRALLAAHALCRGHRFSAPGLARRLILLSDGRSRESLGDLGHTAAALESIVIDCERGRPRLGRARSLARALRAAYHHVDALGPAQPATPDGGSVA